METLGVEKLKRTEGVRLFNEVFFFFFNEVKGKERKSVLANFGLGLGLGGAMVQRRARTMIPKFSRRPNHPRKENENSRKKKFLLLVSNS